MTTDKRDIGGPTGGDDFKLDILSCRSMIESANEGIWILDLDLRITFVNSKACEILGYSREEILGKNPFHFLVKGQTESVLKMAGGIEQGDTIAHERRFHHKNGSIIWVAVNSSSIFDSHGKHTAYLGMFTDITERRKSEQALRESEQKYQLLVEYAGEGIVVVQDGQLKFLNKKMIELIGYSAEELMTGPFTRFIHPEDRALVSERYQRRLQGEIPPALYEFRMVDKSGEIHWAKISSVLIDWEGRPATLNFITDITEYKATQEKIRQRENQIQKEREEFTKKVIEVQEEERKRIARELHDDTAPNLALIIMELDKLLESGETLPAQTLEQLHRLREDTDRAQKEIRRYSHELRPGMLDYLGLEAAIENLAEDVNSRNGIKVSLEIEGEQQRLPGNVELAFFRIAQEALNNIRKHSEATNAVIGMVYTTQSVLLSIKDNGKGFNPAEPRKPEITGGLGLIGMRERAQLIGASLNIRSSPGQGTVVTVEVPTGK